MSKVYSKDSQTRLVMDKAPIRTGNGNFNIWQCKPVLHTKPVVQQKETVGDILNRLQYNNLLRSIVSGK